MLSHPPAEAEGDPVYAFHWSLLSLTVCLGAPKLSYNLS